MGPALFLCLLSPFHAAAAESSVSLYGNPSAEDTLRRFVWTDKIVKAKIDAASAHEETLVAENRDPNLRDALTDSRGGRPALRIDQLPGMNPLPNRGCQALKSCPTPELAIDVANPEQIPDALRQLIRPWMLLQRARGRDIKLTAVKSPEDVVLRLELKKLEAPVLLVKISAYPFGGFKVYLDQPLVLADLYGRERDAILR